MPCIRRVRRECTGLRGSTHPHFRSLDLPFVSVALIPSPFGLQKVENAGKREVLAILGWWRRWPALLALQMLLALLLLLILLLLARILQDLERAQHGGDGGDDDGVQRTLGDDKARSRLPRSPPLTSKCKQYCSTSIQSLSG